MDRQVNQRLAGLRGRKEQSILSPPRTLPPSTATEGESRGVGDQPLTLSGNELTSVSLSHTYSLVLFVQSIFEGASSSVDSDVITRELLDCV
jgi:hypothetical protein